MNRTRKNIAIALSLMLLTGSSLIPTSVAYAETTDGSMEVENVGEISEVAINATNFPDEIFRQYVLDNIDIDGNQVLSTEEISACTSINIENMKIENLSGVNIFCELKYLNCNNNELVSLDVSGNTKLEVLLCCNNILSSLDVSNNMELAALDCGWNALSGLDVSNNSKLELLYCSDNNLTSLDISRNMGLEELNCCGNNIASLDVSNNVGLERLFCADNELSSLSVSNNTGLWSLECHNNKLTNLELPSGNGLKNLAFSYGYPAEINMDHIETVNSISIWVEDGTQTLDLSQVNGLKTELIVDEGWDGSNKVVTLDVKKFEAIPSSDGENNNVYCYSLIANDEYYYYVNVWTIKDEVYTENLSTENSAITAAEFNTILTENVTKDVVIQLDNGIEFTFEKGTMLAVDGKEAYDFGTSIETDYVKAGQMGSSITKENFVARINYNYSGKLPAEASIRFNVGNSHAGKNLYYSRILENGFEYVQSVVVDAEGYVTVKQDHCSDYVLTVDKLEISNDTTVSEDVQTSSGTTKSETPKTGDDSNNVLCIIIMLVCSIGVVAMVLQKKDK